MNKGNSSTEKTKLGYKPKLSKTHQPQEEYNETTDTLKSKTNRNKLFDNNCNITDLVQNNKKNGGLNQF